MLADTIAQASVVWHNARDALAALADREGNRLGIHTATPQAEPAVLSELLGGAAPRDRPALRAPVGCLAPGPMTHILGASARRLRDLLQDLAVASDLPVHATVALCLNIAGLDADDAEAPAKRLPPDAARHVMLALAIAARPRHLLVGSAILADPLDRALISERALRGAARRTSLIAVSHDMSLLDGICDGHFHLRPTEAT